MSEICQRCGQEGEDRRTIWMACFYAMEELGLPLKEEILFSGKPEDMTLAKEATKLNLKDGQTLTLDAGEVKCSGTLTPKGFYTLRVCKDCRADWMQCVQNWFNNQQPARQTGTGIFMRWHGANVEVTEEEYYRHHEELGIPREQIPPPYRVTM